MKPENRGGTRRRDRRLNGRGDRCCLARARYMNAEPACPAKDRDRQGERVPRYIGKGRETAVIYLLVTTRVVEFDDLHELWIFEVGDGRIVESDVPVFANAEANEIDRLFTEHFRVAGNDGGGVRLLGG